MSSEEGRLARGQLTEMVHTYLLEHGPLTLTQLANSMGREGSNLYTTLKKLQEYGRAKQDETTKVWTAIVKDPDMQEESKPTPPPPENNTAPPDTGSAPAPTPTAPELNIEAAIKTLRETSKQQRKLARVREMLVKMLTVIDEG